MAEAKRNGMKDNTCLRTARLRLREIEERDTGFIVRLRSDPEVYRYFVSPHRITREEHLNWYRDSYLFSDDRIDWIAEDCDGNAVGVFGIKTGAEDGTAEVSYILAPEAYGKGYAREAVEAIMGFTVEERRITCFTAEIHRDNQASIRFAEKCGFRAAGQEGDFIRFKRMA